jgi:hypothetical protein
VGERGWINSRPLEPPLRPGSFAERVVSGMIDKELGPVQSPEAKLEKLKAELRALTEAQRAELLRECEARSGDPHAAELKALVEAVPSNAKSPADSDS